jgi:hypothetical protein
MTHNPKMTRTKLVASPATKLVMFIETKRCSSCAVDFYVTTCWTCQNAEEFQSIDAALEDLSRHYRIHLEPNPPSSVVEEVEQSPAR